MRGRIITVTASISLLLGCAGSQDVAAPRKGAASEAAGTPEADTVVSGDSPAATATSEATGAARRSDESKTDYEKVRRMILSMRAEDERIRTQFGKLEVGMTKAEAFRLMGEPDKVEGQRCYWRISPGSQWIDETTRVFGYYVVLEEGRVKRKDVDGAHYTFARPEDGRQ